VVIATLAEAEREVVAVMSTNEEERASVHTRNTPSHFDGLLRANGGSLERVKPTKPYVIGFHHRSIS
jgi:hypothetical protein